MDLVVFSLDHVLYDDRPAFLQHQEKLGAYLVERHIAHNPGDIRTYQEHIKEKWGARAAAVTLSLELDLTLDRVAELFYTAIDLDRAGIRRDDATRRATLSRIPGFKVAYASVPTAYACKVVEHLGLRDSFDQVIGCEAVDMPGASVDTYAGLRAMFSHISNAWLVSSKPQNILASLRSGWHAVYFHPPGLDVGPPATDGNLEAFQRTGFYREVCDFTHLPRFIVPAT